ncbi:MAG: tyrosine recombinase XerC [Oscillospiraceae bacterium]|jgi:site-specific recombinase XerD|nr:tyrosine recombinase XerC [Oscillospiraceae bacterium]
MPGSKNDYSSSPAILREFLTYHESIRGHSKKTVDEYFLDLRVFFRFMKLQRGLVGDGADFNEIPIRDVNLDFIKTITLTDVYDYLSFLARERENSGELGVSAKTRARKLAAIRSFYKYLTVKTHQIATNPVLDIDSPKTPHTLPRFLSLEQSQELLRGVSGANTVRDRCILTLFLNCGLRISEVTGLNLNDIGAESLRVNGKGGKERTVYLNDACAASINAYLQVRAGLTPPKADERALFLTGGNHTGTRNRMTTGAVHALVKKHLIAAGISPTDYSAHKLRHTAATLMLRSGVDVRTLQELLGHEHLNTTQIYTHVEREELREAAMLNPLAEFDPDE